MRRREPRGDGPAERPCRADGAETPWDVEADVEADAAWESDGRPPGSPPAGSESGPRSDPLRPEPSRRVDDAWLLFVLLLAGTVLAALPHLGDPPPPIAVEPAFIDVNRDPPGRLRALPGVGRVLAARIEAERQTAPFTSVADLERVPGVGPVLLHRVGPHVRIGPVPSPTTPAPGPPATGPPRDE